MIELGFLEAIAGIGTIISLGALAWVRARALDRRIREHFEDEENGPKDPYAQMAELMRVQEALRGQVPSRRERR